jgi:hypothetical protein
MSFTPIIPVNYCYALVARFAAMAGHAPIRSAGRLFGSIGRVPVAA